MMHYRQFGDAVLNVGHALNRQGMGAGIATATHAFVQARSIGQLIEHMHHAGRIEAGFTHQLEAGPIRFLFGLPRKPNCRSTAAACPKAATPMARSPLPDKAASNEAAR